MTTEQKTADEDLAALLGEDTPKPQPLTEAFEQKLDEEAARGIVLPEGWRPMAEAPVDGRPVILTDFDGHEQEAVWHRTREFVAKSAVWRAVGWWMARNAGAQRSRVDFEPKAWRFAQ